MSETKWNFNSNNILKEYEEKKKVIDNIILKINNFNLDNENFREFIYLFDNGMTQINYLYDYFEFIRSITINKEVKLICYKLEDSIIEILNNYYNLKNVKLIFNELKNNYPKDNFSNEELEFIDLVINKMFQKGLFLNNKEENKIKSLFKKLYDIEDKFIFNIYTDDETFTFFNDIYKHLCDNGNTMRLSQEKYNLAMIDIFDSGTRRQIQNAYYSKCPKNTINLMNIFNLRSKISKILNLNNFYEYKLIGTNFNIDFIKNLLNSLIEKTNNKYETELFLIQQFSSTNKLNLWDIDYYINQINKNFMITDEYINNFFPLKYTLKKIFKIIGQIFDCSFHKITISTWNENVSVYDISFNSGKFMCRIYLDIFFRINKSKNPQIFKIDTNPSICINMNIKNNNILSFDNLIIFMKLLSNAFIIGINKNHFCLIRDKINKLPIHEYLFEKLCWNYSFLKQISKHIHTNKKIKKSELNKMIKMRNLHKGIYLRKKILNCYYDYITNSSDKFINLFESVSNLNDEKDKITQLYSIMNDIYEKLHHKILFNLNFNTGIFPPSSSLFPINSLLFLDLLSDVYATTLFNYFIKNKFNSYMILNILKYEPFNDIYSKISNKFNYNDCLDEFCEYYDLNKINKNKINKENNKNNDNNENINGFNDDISENFSNIEETEFDDSIKLLKTTGLFIQ